MAPPMASRARSRSIRATATGAGIRHPCRHRGCGDPRAALGQLFPGLVADAPPPRRAGAHLGDRVGSGARTGVRRMRMPSLVNTASKTSVNLTSRSRIKKWKAARRSPKSISRFRAC